MTDPSKFLNTGTLHDLKSVGHHFLHSSRKEGKKTAAPLAFIGAVSIALGVTMVLEAYRQRGEGRSR